MLPQGSQLPQKSELPHGVTHGVALLCTAAVQMRQQEHVVSVVRVMLAHVVKPVFDDHDAVTLSELTSHRMCIHLESTHVTVMWHASDGSRVILRMC